MTHRVFPNERQVCASTSVLMILFSSSAIAISLAFQGLLNVHYAAVFAPACFLASLLGAAHQLAPAFMTADRKLWHVQVRVQ